MSNPIPTQSRVIVTARDQRRCVRCGGMGNTAWHHRRRRGVKDSHTHEACNGISLCVVCHSWVHANPRQATEFGWIVPTWGQPNLQPVQTFQYGWVELRCDGTLTLLSDCENCGLMKITEGGWCLECLSQEDPRDFTRIEKLRERLQA